MDFRLVRPELLETSRPDEWGAPRIPRKIGAVRALHYSETVMASTLRGSSVVLTLGVLTASASLFAACSSDSADGVAGGHDFKGGGGDASAEADAAPTCTSSAQCNGGVCVDGVCCNEVCGDECCTGSAVCLIGHCVVPGADCHSAHDCQQGQYCETALGDNDDAGAAGAAGAGGAAGAPGDAGDGGPVCTQPPPLDGRCVDLPKVCDGTTDAGCVTACEYHPPVGQLNVVEKWTWGPQANEFPNFTDVWATPSVGRVYDGNCDGKIDDLDAPDIIFVAGNVAPSNTPEDNGVLRMLDGRNGHEIWSLRSATPSSKGFMGFSSAIGDLDGDGHMEIVAGTGEHYVAVIDANGNLVTLSDTTFGGNEGWGGGFAIADMDGDGYPEIAFGATVWEFKSGALTHKWTGQHGIGGGGSSQLSTFVDLDGDQHLELLAGNTAYKSDGSVLWNRSDLSDGFPGVGDFDLDGKPDVVMNAGAKVWILDGATGQTKLGPGSLPGSGGGPPTVADFDGDGKPEIGIALANYYAVAKPDFASQSIGISWKMGNHDFSSSVTGSTVFDFEGDGHAEVIYGDECYLWVFDGETGAVRFATSHTSFTATEASLLADVDGDGRAEMVMISNGASPVTWQCLNGGTPTTINGIKWEPGPSNNAYRGITVFGDRSNGWVGTRTLWNEHTYHVTNICDDHDSACDAPNVYGSIPKHEKSNWTLPWLNDFRQNVQDKGIFDAPDATVSLQVSCANPPLAKVAVRNSGLAPLPAGVDVGLYVVGSGSDTLVVQTQTTHPLASGQTEVLDVAVPSGAATSSDTFVAKIIVDPQNPKFHECHDDNDESNHVKPACTK
jgi:FG-GAP-like repeat